MRIEPSLLKIESLQNKFYVVPDYQREYVWKKDIQVKQFIDDIFRAAESDDSYFIGSMIIVEREDKRYDVIDGQQRLTTIMLCICAISYVIKQIIDKCGDNDIKRRMESLKGVCDKLLYDYDIETFSSNYRLSLQYEESRNVLEYIINNRIKGDSFPVNYGKNMSNSAKCILEAYKYIENSFKELFASNNIKDALPIIAYFLTKVQIVEIETKNLSNALKIFETINQRGAGLNAMDLIKNLLFISAKETDFKKIKEIWKNINEELKKCNEEEKPMRFLRYYLMARYTSYIIRENDIYTWLTSKESKEKIQYEKNPVGFANDILNYVKVYSRLANATEKYNPELPNLYNIGLLNKKRSRSHLPLFLALPYNASNEMIELLANSIENYLFYTISLRYQAKTNETLFARIAAEIRKVSTIEELKIVVDKEFGIIVHRKLLPQFMNEIKVIKTNVYQPDYRLRYILGKIENFILSKCGLPCRSIKEYESYQIEHILPQTPKNDYVKDWVREEYDTYVHFLGNVVLLESSINQSIGRYNDFYENWFEKKQDEYYNSNLSGTRLLSTEYKIGKDTALNRFRDLYDYKFDVWDKNAIEKRQDFLGKVIPQIWYFDKIKTEAIVLEDILENEKIINQVNEEPEQYTQLEFNDDIDEISKLLESTKEEKNSAQLNNPYNIFKRFNFKICNIPLGATLVFIPNPNIKVKVSSDNTIEYQGINYKLSPFCQKFMPEEKRYASNQYQGSRFFSYENEVLDNIFQRKLYELVEIIKEDNENLN